MKAKNKVVYVPPVYEEVQHEVTSVDDNNVPLRTSFHTDVSLLQRIGNKFNIFMFRCFNLKKFTKMLLSSDTALDTRVTTDKSNTMSTDDRNRIITTRE